MQVGTSRLSSVSGGADYLFTLTQTRENRFSCISPATAGIPPGGELDDSDQAGPTTMPAGGHEVAHLREALEIGPLPGQQRVPLEVRDHPVEDVLEPPRLPLEGLVAAIRADASASEVSLNQLKHLGPVSVLTDGEARPHLPTRDELGSGRDGDGEAALFVDVPGDVGREELATVSGAGV